MAGVLIFSDPGAKNSACFMEVILRHYKLIYKKEVTKMDEMNNVTMENETSMMENAPVENLVPVEAETILRTAAVRAMQTSILARSSRSVLVLRCSSALV